jgi:hypothetical protein
MVRLPFVYLTSPPFSGSTLFSLMVNTHPNIATVGEMTGVVKSTDPDTYYCSCGEKIRDCRFWRKVSAQMISRNFSFDPAVFDTKVQFATGLFGHRLLNGSIRNNMLEDCRDRVVRFFPRHRRRLDYLVARNKALAESILQVTGKSMFFDASKNPRIIRHFIREPTINLRVVHLVRDVRGTSLSRRKNKGETDWRRAVNHWVRANRTIESQLRRLPVEQWIRIRYADGCGSPESPVQGVLGFWGVAARAGRQE